MAADLQFAGRRVAVGAEPGVGCGAGPDGQGEGGAEAAGWAGAAAGEPLQSLFGGLCGGRGR